MLDARTLEPNANRFLNLWIDITSFFRRTHTLGHMINYTIIIRRLEEKSVMIIGREKADDREKGEEKAERGSR